jgi:hypothetical protein
MGFTSYWINLFAVIMLAKFAPYFGLVAYLLRPIAWAKAIGSEANTNAGAYALFESRKAA